MVFFKKWILNKFYNRIEKDEDNYAIIFFFFMCCTIMTIGAQSISWLPGASDSISHGYRSMDYGIKACTYLRYFGVYIGPLLMCGLVGFEKFRQESIKAVSYAIPVSGCCLLGWLILIQPFIYENIYTSEFFTGISFFKVGEQFELRHYLIGILWMIIVAGFVYSFLLKGELKKLIYLFTFYLVFQYCTNGMNYDISRQKRNLTVADGGYQTIKQLEEKIDLPKKIYCYEGRKKEDHHLYYIYQFYLNRYQIIPVSGKEVNTVTNGELIFSNIKDERILLQKGYSCIQIDSNEYLYIDEKYSTIRLM